MLTLLLVALKLQIIQEQNIIRRNLEIKNEIIYKIPIA